MVSPYVKTSNVLPNCVGMLEMGRVYLEQCAKLQTLSIVHNNSYEMHKHSLSQVLLLCNFYVRHW